MLDMSVQQPLGKHSPVHIDEEKYTSKDDARRTLASFLLMYLLPHVHLFHPRLLAFQLRSDSRHLLKSVSRQTVQDWVKLTARRKPNGNTARFGEHHRASVE